MNRPRWILCILSLLLLIGCGESKDKNAEHKDGFTPVLNTKEDSLNHEIMEGHDMAMARMSKLDKYIAQTKQALDSLQRVPTEKLDILYQQDLAELQKKLDAAKDGMNTWMDTFKPDSAENDKELRIKYLESEKEKVQKMKTAVLSSLQKADLLFKK